MMKRIIATALSLSLAFALTACGAASSSVAPEPTAEPTPKDYASIIHDARTDELNQNVMIVSPADEGEGYNAIDGFSADIPAENLQDELVNLYLPILGVDFNEVTDFAFSGSPMSFAIHTVAILMPAEGKTDSVKAALEAYVELQKTSNYEAIAEGAKSAVISVMDSGEVVLVCTENSAELFASIEAALAA